MLLEEWQKAVNELYLEHQCSQPEMHEDTEDWEDPRELLQGILDCDESSDEERQRAEALALTAPCA